MASTDYVPSKRHHLPGDLLDKTEEVFEKDKKHASAYARLFGMRVAFDSAIVHSEPITNVMPKSAMSKISYT